MRKQSAARIQAPLSVVTSSLPPDGQFWLKMPRMPIVWQRFFTTDQLELPGVHFTQKVESNQLFLDARPVIDELLKDYFFYFWDEAIHEIRL